MQRVRATIQKLARSQAPVLISCESGVGKELAARSIHEQGTGAAGAVVRVMGRFGVSHSLNPPAAASR